LMLLRIRNEFEYAEQGFSDAGLHKKELVLRIMVPTSGYSKTNSKKCTRQGDEVNNQTYVTKESHKTLM